MPTEIQAKRFWIAEALKNTLMFREIFCKDRNLKMKYGNYNDVNDGKQHVVVGNGERCCAKK